MNPLTSTQSPVAPFPSPLRRLAMFVAATLLVACQGEPPFACGTIPVQELYERQTKHFDPCFEDPEGENLTLSAISSDPGIASVRVAGSTITIKGESVGSTTITVTATDPDGETAMMDIAVVVPKKAVLAVVVPKKHVM